MHQGITTLIECVASVSLNPLPGDSVPSSLLIKLLPKVTIQHWFLIRFYPPTLLPTNQPPFGHRVDEIFRIRIQSDLARLLKNSKRRDRRHKLHAIISGMIKRPFQLLTMLAKNDDCPKSPRPGISAGSSICVYFNPFHKAEILVSHILLTASKSSCEEKADFGKMKY